MPVHREPPPPGLVAAAEQDYHSLQSELANLISKARELMAARHTEVEALTDLWLTLLWQDPRRVALLGATAVVELVKAGNGRDARDPRRPGQ